MLQYLENMTHRWKCITYKVDLFRRSVSGGSPAALFQEPTNSLNQPGKTVLVICTGCYIKTSSFSRLDVTKCWFLLFGNKTIIFIGTLCIACLLKVALFWRTFNSNAYNVIFSRTPGRNSLPIINQDYLRI